LEITISQKDIERAAGMIVTTVGLLGDVYPHALFKVFDGMEIGVKVDTSLRYAYQLYQDDGQFSLDDLSQFGYHLVDAYGQDVVIGLLYGTLAIHSMPAAILFGTINMIYEHYGDDIAILAADLKDNLIDYARDIVNGVLKPHNVTDPVIRMKYNQAYADLRNIDYNLPSAYSIKDTLSEAIDVAFYLPDADRAGLLDEVSNVIQQLCENNSSLSFSDLKNLITRMQNLPGGMSLETRMALWNNQSDNGERVYGDYYYFHATKKDKDKDENSCAKIAVR